MTAGLPSSALSGIASPADALRAEEVKRTRDLLRVGWVVALMVVAAVSIAPGDRRIALALMIALGACVVGSVWMHAVLVDPSRYSPARMNVLALLALACGQLGTLYVGVFSAAPIMVALGLYFFCRTESLRSAIAIYLIAAGAHGVEAGLVIGGVIDDPGFYPVGASATVQAQIAGQLLLQLAYALCFWLARITRRTSLRSIEQLQRATRLAAQRDVQLAELRHDLDRALEIGGPGRFTGVVVGSWELGKVIGRGAMGEVYEAIHTARGEPAAVKVLRRELLADPRHVERFFREVRIASAIDSPHAVRVLEASRPTDALPFLAMERLVGQTLGSLLRNGRCLSDEMVLGLVTQVGSVLELARAAGVVHRDLKPQNLFLSTSESPRPATAGPGHLQADQRAARPEGSAPRDLWKVLDFGVALLVDGSGTLTRGAAVGTPAYMSPEQAQGGDVDHRTDVYALGAVVYRCMTGRQPFTRPDTPALLYAVVHEMPLRPSSLAPLSPEIDAVLRVALAKDRDARFGTAAELVAALTAALNGSLPESARPDGDVWQRARALAPWTEPPARPSVSSL